MSVAERPAADILTYGFRPFFLAAAIWSGAAIALWIVMLRTGFVLPSRFDPLAWHIHEMLFGFVMAAIAGFLLTAIANWTQRPPVHGRALALLGGLWLLGRLVCLISALLPPWLVVAADLSFPAVLIATIAREIAAAHNWRNLPMIAPVGVLGVANLLMHLESDGIGVPAGLGWRLGLCAVIVLISAVAGRIVPSFTRNWLVQNQGGEGPPAPGLLDRASLGVLHTGLLGWAVFPDTHVVGGLLICGALLNLWRLARWRGVATTAEPLLFILHIGYAWLVLGVALLGLSTLGIAVPLSAAIHSLTVGAIGTMILAVMTRVARGHTGRPLAANLATNLIYLSVSAAALTRVAAAFDIWSSYLLLLSAALWIAAFGIFAAFYGPMLVRPRAGSAA
jgi:uncharacterized protein involved in response to NO